MNDASYKNHPHLFDGGSDQQARQEVGEVPALLGVGTALGHGGGVCQEAHHTSAALNFIYLNRQILTHFKLWTTQHKCLLPTSMEGSRSPDWLCVSKISGQFKKKMMAFSGSVGFCSNKGWDY